MRVRARARVRVRVRMLRLPRSALRGSQSAAPAAPATKSALKGPQSAAPATISENDPRVQDSRFTARHEIGARRRSPPTILGSHSITKNAIKQLSTLFCKALMPLPVFTAIWFFHGFNSLSSRFSRLFAAKSRFFTSKCTLFHGLRLFHG